MTITVEIKPEVRAELVRQASAQGRALEAHAARPGAPDGMIAATALESNLAVVTPKEYSARQTAKSYAGAPRCNSKFGRNQGKYR